MNARRLAFTLLKQICIEQKYSNLLLRNELNKADKKDKGLITQIVYGTLQNYRYCRYQWVPLVHKLPSVECCILLDMSVYQFLCMDKLPSYAIINEAVNIAKSTMSSAYTGLINAVLHKIEKQGERLIEGSAEHILAVRTSHPDWLIAMWKSQYGFETTEKICWSNMDTKAQCVRVNTLKTSKEQLLENPLYTNANIAVDALMYHGESLVQTDAYQQGLLSIQDESSQLVSEMLQPQPQECILDVCSAPGTKACHIAQMMNNEGYILCGDIHPHRVALIEEGATRLGIDIMEARVMDASTLEGVEDHSFDRVLCDVPCSGYGVLSRKSDIKYHMNSEDMDTLIPLQQSILVCASKKLKTGGILVYSTCTLNKKENEKQVECFLKNNPNFEKLEEQTIFPFFYDSDGFYMAKLKRID